MNILLIEDDPGVIEAVSIVLDMRWPEAKLINTNLGEKGIELAESEKPDIIILDLGLPDLSGFEILKSIRLFSNVPILILTVRSEESDIIKGLEWGADDYVIKPFRQLELLSRLRALLRRAAPIDNITPIANGPFRYYPDTRQLLKGDKEISLTPSESHIFYELIKNAGQIVTYSQLSESLWGDDLSEAADSIKVYIRRLRQKVEDNPDKPSSILTKSTIGYMLAKES